MIFQSAIFAISLLGHQADTLIANNSIIKEWAKTDSRLGWCANDFFLHYIPFNQIAISKKYICVKCENTLLSLAQFDSKILQQKFSYGLHLSACKIEHKLLKLLLQNDNIKVLIIHDCVIDDYLFELISSSNSIEVLQLLSTNVSGKDISKFKRMKSLEYIVFKGTSASDRELQQLAQISSLKGVYLSERSITLDAISNLLKKLSTLDALALNFVKLDMQAIVNVSRLKRLKYLELRGAHLTTNMWALLSRFDSLMVLDASDNEVTLNILDEFARLSSLQSLVLRNAKLSNESLASISKMRQLRSLFVSQNRITDEGISHLGKLTNLECLELAYTDIQGHSLKDLQSLTILLLVNSKINKSTIAIAASLPKLFLLDISRCFDKLDLDDIKAILASKVLLKCYCRSIYFDKSAKLYIFNFDIYKLIVTD
ncbi:MAG: hypothetical protein R3B84_15565 [Zavarzinella sp.]